MCLSDKKNTYISREILYVFLDCIYLKYSYLMSENHLTRREIWKCRNLEISVVFFSTYRNIQHLVSPSEKQTRLVISRIRLVSD